MINTVVLDIGNVLAHFGWKEYLEGCGYDKDTILRLSNATVLDPIWKEWDRGIREEAELIELCCRKEPSLATEIRRFFDYLPNIVKEYDYSASFIKELKHNGYQVYLLSNYSKRMFEINKREFEFIHYVDGGVISYEIQHVKPEPPIYEELMKRYDFDPRKAVFLDDLQINLEGARIFGFQTILVQSFEQAVGDLRKLGVKI